MLGKIDRCTFGFGGYDDAMFGLSIGLSSGCGGTGDFKGTWYNEPNERTKWTIEDQSKVFAETSRFIIQLLKDAKKEHIGQLVGVPVEIEIEDGRLKSWRVLTEVL